MKRLGIETPVLLGGAALTRRYVEIDCRASYSEKVFYAKDAFAGLQLMNKLMVEKG
jgi:5-methyltetrahydrofolate--homocysteine methyltransferase